MNRVYEVGGFYGEASFCGLGVFGVGAGLGQMLHDGPSDKEILSQYFSDLFMIFLKRVTALGSLDHITDSDSAKLKDMLNDLLDVRKRLEEEL